MAVGRYKFLEQAIMSIVKQSDPNWELIIFNNKKCEFGVDDKRVKVIDTDDWHPAKCYNEGIKLAKYHNICIATDDDISFQDRAVITNYYLNEHEFVGGSCITTREDLKPIHYIHVRPFKYEWHRRVANTISLPFAGFRKHAIVPFREDFQVCYDYLFTLQCAKNGADIVTTKTPLRLRS